MENFEDYRKKLQVILDKSKNIIVTMSSPDGDSIASSIALKNILEQLGKSVDIICSFDLGSRFDSYPGVSSIITADISRLDYSKYEACFTLDAGQLARLTKTELLSEKFYFPKKLEVINIDHHHSNDLFGTLNVNIISAPCTAFVIDKLFDGMYRLDEFISTLMYFSVVYDTGNFRFTLSKELFDFASKCINYGAQTEKVLEDYYNNRSITQTKYEAILLQRLEQKENYIYTFAYFDDIEKYGIDVGKFLSSTATIARDYLSSFKEADFGWVLSERKHDIVKIEMRAKIDNSPIIDITQALGGGGHKRACGAKVMNKSIEEVQNFILEYLK